MPFQSQKQRRFLHAKHPALAKKWEKKYGSESEDEKDGKKKKPERLSDLAPKKRKKNKD